MRIDVFTIFAGMLEAPLRQSLLGKAIAEDLVQVWVHDLRTFATDAHHQVDDTSFGGGPGMVMKAEPVFAAVESLDPDRGRVILLSPAGRRLDQALVRELSAEAHLTLVCGRYEGVDERVVEGLPAEELSIGDYVLSGGEVPALVLIEAVIERIGSPGASARPREFREMQVPEVLLSGNHGEIEAWRREAARDKTRRNRPDLG